MTTSQLDITNESQEVSPFPAGDHKAQHKPLLLTYNYIEHVVGRWFHLILINNQSITIKLSLLSNIVGLSISKAPAFQDYLGEKNTRQLTTLSSYVCMFDA